MAFLRGSTRAVALVGAVCMIVSLAGTPASADPKGVEPNRAQSARTSLAAKDPTGVSTQALPSACVGRTHDPHLSYSFASVHGDTGCPYVVPMIVSINLLRWRWYGLQHLANGSRSGTTSYVNGNAKWYCSGTGTYTYRGESYHRATVGGTNYIGYTANENRFAC